MPRMKKFLKKCGEGGIIKMNKKQYNNVIENTLKFEKTDDSLTMARAIFENMGISLPQGDIKTVYETIKTDDYMGWKSCSMKEAQTAADKGVAAIGISEDKVVVLSANDEEQPVRQIASVVTLKENDLSNDAVNLLYYTYSNDTTHENYDSWNELVFSNLDVLHQLARQYDSSNQMKLTLQFIRRKVYADGLWDYVAGEIEEDFVDYVERNNKYIYDFFNTKSLLIYDRNGSPIDFLHLCATMNGIIVGGGTYWKALVVGQTHVRNLAGWAGDLQTLVVETYALTEASNSYSTFYATFFAMMGSEEHSFGMKDLLADVDALNFANNWISNYWQSNLFGSACRYYYNNINIPGTGWTSKANLRFSQFFGSLTKTQFADTVGDYTKQNWALGIEWPLYAQKAKEWDLDLDLTDTQSDAARDAFTDFMWIELQYEQYINANSTT